MNYKKRVIFSLILIFLSLVMIFSSIIAYKEKIDLGTAIVEALDSILHERVYEKDILLSLLELIIVLFALSIIYYLIHFMVKEFLVSGDFKKIWRLIKMKQLKNHIIICGGGRVGRSLAKLLGKEKVIIIEKDKDIAKDLEEKGFLVVNDDALDEFTLEKANVKEAKVLAAVLGNSADNLFIILTAKSLNPNLFVVGRADYERDVPKLKRAGADYVIVPALSGAKELAKIILEK